MSIILKSGVSGNLATIDSLGNLQVLSSPAALTQTATAWSSGTAGNTTQALLTTGGYPLIVLQLDQTSTITSGAITFEGTFDGINWVSIPTAQLLDPNTFVAQTNPYTLVASTNKAWAIQVNGYQQVRYRLSTAIGGTGTITPYWTLETVSFTPLSTTLSGTVTVTGTVTSNIGTTGGLALDATLTGGTQKTKIVDTGGTNVATVSAAGAVKVDGSAVTQPVSGTVAVTQSTSPWVVSLTSTTITGTVAATQSGTWSTRMQDGAGTALTSTGSALDINIKTSAITLPVSLTSTTITSTVAVTQSGTWTVQPGNTANTTPWLFTVSQGGNAATVSAGGALKVDGSAATQPVSGTITANIGTTNGLALDASVTGLQVAQGSTTAAQKGGLTLGAVTTAAPAYTTAQTSPLSLTTAGGLRVDGSAVTQPVSGTITANAGTGNFTVAQATGTNLHAVIDSGTITTITNTVTVSGTVAATQSGNWTSRIVGNAGATLDAAGQNAASPSNSLLIAGQFNTAPTTITSGNVSPLQLTATGGLITDNVELPTPAVSADATANPTISQIGSENMAFNGTTWDRARTAGIGNNVASTGIVATAKYGQFNTTLPVLTTGNYGAAQLDSSGRQIVNTPQKATYRAATAVLFAAAAGTGLFFVIAGSASKTIRVQRVTFAGVTSGTLGIDRVQVAKYSTAPTVGTAVTLTKVPLDSASAAATANLCQVYTAAPTAGTKVGDIGSQTVIAKSATVVEGAEFTSLVWDFRSVGETSAVVLRGVAENLGLYFNIAPAAAPNCQVEVEWTEE